MPTKVESSVEHKLYTLPGRHEMPRKVESSVEHKLYTLPGRHEMPRKVESSVDTNYILCQVDMNCLEK